MCDLRCQNGGLCRSTGGSSFYCDCPLNYKGKLCESSFIDCTDYEFGSVKWHCYNGGKCHHEVEGSCDCVGNWTGRFCQRNPNAPLPQAKEEEKDGAGISGATRSALIYFGFVVVACLFLYMVIDKCIVARYVRRRKAVTQRKIDEDVKADAWETESGRAVPID